ncbi:MAG: hypothetical protein AAB719_00355 [Patescibacteria group bacterium]
MTMGNLDILLFITSGIFGVVAYRFYFKDIRDSVIKPNRWSWLIFCIATLLEVLTYNEVSGDLVKSSLFFISAICTFIIAALLWSRSTWKKPDWTEFICLSASIISLILWLGFNETLWAHIMLVVAIPISFIPIYRDSWNDWRVEDTVAWQLWTFGDLLAIFLVLTRLDKFEELPFAIVEFLSHATVWFLVSRGKRIFESSLSKSD